ncbi:MAG TPA: serine hydrolase [Vicinamibacterales bacterium]
MNARFTSFLREDTKITKATKNVWRRSVFVFFVILRVFVITNAADDETQIAKQLKANYERRLQDIASHVDGVVGYEVLDLTSGDRIGHLEQAVFPTASTIKLAIVYELFKRVEEGSVDLNQTIVLDRAKAVAGSGVLHELGTPTLSIRDYATLMVVLSDNTATNVLIDRLGMDNITKRMVGLGFANTRLRRKMIDIDAAKRGEENVSTPKEIVDLLAAMSRPATGRFGPDMIALLEKSKASRLRKGLPPGIQTADKPGELEGVRVDAGIVYAKNRPYVLCVMTTYLKSEAEGEQAIEEMSRASYEYFSRLGAGLQYGRQIGK